MPSYLSWSQGYLPERTHPGKHKSWQCLEGSCAHLLFRHFQGMTSKHMPFTPYPLALYPQISGGCS